jgi:hypothetical protein
MATRAAGKGSRDDGWSEFSRALSASERRLLARLDSPLRVQEFLDTLQYSADDFYRSPLRVVRERIGHCFDGAVCAAALLRRLGHPPLLVDLLPNERDDDHLLALYRVDGHWGAVAKSNFVGLRFREPIHRNLRELALSYFEQYYNVAREKTLRAYTTPVNLARFDRLNWLVDDAAMDAIAARLDEVRKYALLSPEQVARLSPVDPRTHEAGLQGANAAGLWHPPRS